MFADKVYSETFVSATNGGKAGDNLIQLSPNLLKKLPIGPYFIVLHDGSNVLGRGKFTTK